MVLWPERVKKLEGHVQREITAPRKGGRNNISRKPGKKVILRCREYSKPALDKANKDAAEKRRKKKLEISGFMQQI